MSAEIIPEKDLVVISRQTQMKVKYPLLQPRFGVPFVERNSFSRVRHAGPAACLQPFPCGPQGVRPWDLQQNVHNRFCPYARYRGAADMMDPQLLSAGQKLPQGVRLLRVPFLPAILMLRQINGKQRPQFLQAHLRKFFTHLLTPSPRRRGRVCGFTKNTFTLSVPAGLDPPVQKHCFVFRYRQQTRKAFDAFHRQAHGLPVKRGNLPRFNFTGRILPILPAHLKTGKRFLRRAKRAVCCL